MPDERPHRNDESPAKLCVQLWPVVAHGGEAVDAALVDSIVDRRREDLLDEPVAALVAATAGAGLLVVGSRGLHGLSRPA